MQIYEIRQFSFTLIDMGGHSHLNPNQVDVRKALPGLGPIYLSCFWSDFENSFVCWKLVKIVIDFYSISNFYVHRLTARRRRSDEGQFRQFFQAKNQKISILSYKQVMYIPQKNAFFM